jgi:surfeit locus 1 family protein
VPQHSTRAGKETRLPQWRKIIPPLAATAGIALTFSLGMWQYGRGQQKSELAARVEHLAREAPIQVTSREIDAPDVELRRVEARGTFDPQYAVFLDNRVWHGVVGYQVIMPLRLEGGTRHLLVNRGWMAASRDRRAVPSVNTPAEPVTVRGRAVLPGRFLELSDKVAEGPVWQNLTLERYRDQMPIAIHPFMVQQDAEGAPEDGLIREWPAPDLGVDKHYGYAVQWFSLALLIFVFYVVAHVRRYRKP